MQKQNVNNRRKNQQKGEKQIKIMQKKGERIKRREENGVTEF